MNLPGDARPSGGRAAIDRYGPGVDPLLEALAEAQQRGAIGSGPLAEQVAHSLAFAVAWPALLEARAVLDLGTGGGLPGLVLAWCHRGPRYVLIESRLERARLVDSSVRRLGLESSVTVLAERAEDAGRRSELRGRFDVVVARSFAPPAVTAECGAPFVDVGGALVVSEPPGAPSRWPEDGLRLLGLSLAAVTTEPRAFVVLGRMMPCPERYPRRVGVPAKRPLF